MKQNKLSVLRFTERKKGAGLRLAEGLNAIVNVCKRKPLHFPENYVLNWGRSERPVWLNEAEDSSVTFINHPDAVARAVNKLECFKLLEKAGVPTLKFTDSLQRAEDWVSVGGARVFCRTLINSSRGKGIVIVDRVCELVDAPLYTLAFDKTHEFRVHIFRGEVVDYVQKKKKSTKKLLERGLEYNSDIRNIANGSVFCRKDIIDSEEVKEIASRAVSTLGLDFGAVDMLATVDTETGGVLEARVCEVNTAPQLKGTTLKKYVAIFEKLIK